MILETILALGLLGEVEAKGFDLKEIDCLTRNIYHEARGEGVRGMNAVAHVTLNRVASKAFPDTICGVVHQSKQFSWVPKKPAVSDPVAYENALSVALAALDGLSPDPTYGATYFYDHRRSSPRWSHGFKTTAVIGGHTFKRGKK